jgi:hypothetical protein
VEGKTIVEMMDRWRSCNSLDGRRSPRASGEDVATASIVLRLYKEDPMSRSFVLPLTAALCLSTGAFAADFYPWRNHEAPFDFIFGNDIDTHQQTRQARDGSLFGFFYVAFTGVVTKDRYPIATHVDCNSNPGCTVGWTLSGKPMSATFLYQVMDDHPVFLVSRQDIPQPGAYSHFHWLGLVTLLPRQPPLNGFLLQLTAVDRFCFLHHETAQASARSTCRENGGIEVERGTDIATHLNIVTSAPTGM